MESGHVVAIIPAAGESHRFSGTHKLVERIGRQAVIELTIRRVSDSPVDRVIVVSGTASVRLRRILDNLDPVHEDLRIVPNPDHASGLGSSIAAGVAACSTGDDILIWPADMPMIRGDTAAQVISAGKADSIVIPVFEGKRGHPVFFGRSFRDELLALEGDTGGRAVIDRHPDAVHEVQVADPGIHFDIDTEEDLSKAAELLLKREHDA
jgi:molybdenum cofactor cytidylyltransferase